MRHPSMLLALTLCGCGATFTPETLVDRLRVLSLVASPPEVAPGESANLEVLYLDPSRPGQPTTVIWVGCDPDPFNLGRGACNDTTALLQPTAFTSFPPGVKILGFGSKATYTPPANLFAPLEPNDPIRTNGTVGQVLSVVIGEEVDPTSDDAELRELFGRIERQEIQTILGLTRVTVSEKAVQNTNPTLSGLEVDGEPLPVNGTLLLRPGQQVTLTPRAPEADRERYTLLLPDGPQERTERLVAAWYSTAGRFSTPRVDLDDAPGTELIAPGSAEIPDDPIPPRRVATAWVVLRDSRGGQSNRTVPMFVCDETLPRPNVTGLEVPSSREQPLRATGENLASIADVVIGGHAMARGSALGGGFLGDWPALPAGTYPVDVRGKDCSVQRVSFSVTLP